MVEHHRFEPETKLPSPRRLCARLRGATRRARERATAAGENPKLAEHAELIRTLGKRVIADIIEIGRRLREAKGLVGHGGWESWLKKEFNWSQDTALNFMRVYELAENHKSRKFLDLKIAPSALYLLAQKSTPETVRTAIIERAEAGEDITIKTVKALTAKPIKIVDGLPPVTAETKTEPRDTAANAPADAVAEQAESEKVEESRWERDAGRMIVAAEKATAAAKTLLRNSGPVSDWLMTTIKKYAEELAKLAEHVEKLHREQQDATAEEAVEEAA